MILTPTTFSDHRGQFRECFRQDEFEKHCGHYPLVQDNLSRSVGARCAVCITNIIDHKVNWYRLSAGLFLMWRLIFGQRRSRTDNGWVVD